MGGNVNNFEGYGFRFADIDLPALLMQQVRPRFQILPRNQASIPNPPRNQASISNSPRNPKSSAGFARVGLQAHANLAHGVRSVSCLLSWLRGVLTASSGVYLLRAAG
eukprot:2922327-Rhodomonas_salina.1